MAPKKKRADKKQLECKEKDHDKQLLSDDITQPPQLENQELQQSQSVQGTVTSTESAKRKSGGPRSVCAMYKVVKKKALGKRVKVAYNEHGVPCGSTRHTLQSYIGMLARTWVPIDIPNWPAVDTNLKQKIWLDVQV